MRRAPFAHIANVSLWEAIRRSLATTFITLLPLLALYFFGGETLKDFAFALLIGIGSGAYSSIFIAAPVVSMLKEREPEYARRKDGADHDAGARGRRRSRPRRMPPPTSPCPSSCRSPRRTRLRSATRATTSANGDASGGAAARTAVPADPADNGTLRSELERLILAAVGAVALTGERADALADEFAPRGQVRRDEARDTIDDVRAPLAWGRVPVRGARGLGAGEHLPRAGPRPAPRRRGARAPPRAARASRPAARERAGRRAGPPTPPTV